MPKRPPQTPAIDREKHRPWHPYKWEDADAGALQALVRGDAQPHQQQRAIKLIVEGLCDTYGMSYYPFSTRDSDFAEGKRFVGNQIIKLIKLNLAKLSKE